MNNVKLIKLMLKIVGMFMLITWPLLAIMNEGYRRQIKQRMELDIHSECADLALKSKGTDYEVVLESCVERKMKGGL
jgi:hypothetical protein